MYSMKRPCMPTWKHQKVNWSERGASRFGSSLLPRGLDGSPSLCGKWILEFMEVSSRIMSGWLSSWGSGAAVQTLKQIYYRPKFNPVHIRPGERLTPEYWEHSIDSTYGSDYSPILSWFLFNILCLEKNKQTNRPTQIFSVNPTVVLSQSRNTVGKKKALWLTPLPRVWRDCFGMRSCRKNTPALIKKESASLESMVSGGFEYLEPVLDFHPHSHPPKNLTDVRELSEDVFFFANQKQRHTSQSKLHYKRHEWFVKESTFVLARVCK